jgi:hypothetical protein
VDLENVRPARRLLVLAAPAHVVQERVVHPLAVERDDRVRHRALVAAVDQHLLAAVGVEQHQVGARLRVHRTRDLRVELAVDGVAEAVGADVDDVEVVLDRLVRRDVRDVAVDRV